MLKKFSPLLLLCSFELFAGSLRIAPIANDDYASVTVGGNSSTSVSLTANDRYGSIAVIDGSTFGRYGYLQFLGTTATYTLYDNDATASLTADQTVTDTFTYTYSNDIGQSASARFIVQIRGNQKKAPVALDDYASLVAGINKSITGNLTANDRYGSIVTFDGSTSGRYGFLQKIVTSGDYTYELYDNSTNASLAAGQTATDTFTYTYANDLGQSASARLIIQVMGNQQAPVAQDDYASVVVGITPSVVGNLTTNDRNGSIVTLNGSAAGQYGYLLLSADDGSYIYTLYDNGTNANLAANQTFTDTFTYNYANALGQSANARLIVQVAGGQQQKPVAIDDYASVVVGVAPGASGNLSSNDRYGSIVTVDGSTAGRYGFLQLNGTSGAYTYTLYDNSANAALAAGQSVSDIFVYTYANKYGQSASARLTVNVTSGQQGPVALDDNVTLVPTKAVFSVSGNVSDNDKNGKSFNLSSSPASNYGNLILKSDGSFTYTLYVSAPSVIALKAGQVVVDSFSYIYTDQYGKSVTARLNVNIIGNPLDANGNTIFETPVDVPYDNVDVEFNNRSANATPLNSGRNIRGHLYDPSDKDWYLLHSAGNEIINLDFCPKGSSCFDKKSWVMYVFDKAKLTSAMELSTYTFLRWVEETGSTKDVLGNVIMNGLSSAGSSNDMYLAYRLGYFEGALIGIVDPCFDKTSSVEIGVKVPGDYLIAVSATLMGSDSSGKPLGKCGEGNVVLRKPGASAVGKDAEGKPKTYVTTEEYIFAFPFSDDQYVINITGTGLNPLLSEAAAARSAAFNANTGELNIPKLRVLDKLYDASLTLQKQLVERVAKQSARGASDHNTLKFVLRGIEGLDPKEIADAFQATYNVSNQQLIIPRVTDTVSNNAYSVIMQYHPELNGKAPWLEVIEATLIK